MKLSRLSSNVLTLLLLAIAISLAGSARATEPWADDQLTVTDGLLVWLDAGAFQDVYEASGTAPLREGDPIDVWPDASGRNADFVQTNAEAQPSYRPTGDFHAVHFDASGQHLRLSNPLPPTESLTVFIVAAPYSSPGPFSAFLSASATQKNDFQTGINIDQGIGSQGGFNVLNVEGQGSPGLQNLLKEGVSFGTIVRICVTSTPGEDGVSLSVNGTPQGRRDRAAGDEPIHLNEVILGGRHYNLGGLPEVRDFFHGDIAEALVFDRVLSDEERGSVEEYLATKYGEIEDLPLPQNPEGGKPLARVEDPAPVQVFVPGFSVREVPVDLTNINNIKYRHDGVLFALGYDGRIWRLRDTDGDGAEDDAAIFWENSRGVRSAIGMDLTPPNYEHGDGAFIVGKTECLLIVDTDGDDKADREIEVAGGWKEGFHGVDALGVAFDPRDGSVYYGRGTHNFTDPLLRDKDGNAGYALEKESGVVIRVSPEFKSREIFATGIRFPVAIRFNRDGDLFCTDQEGATWVPNGNPLDELLHVQKGRHYGFPPRHPSHLPDVIDEPSTFDYSPQHQSTCGFNFNEPVTEGGPAFGPAAWAGDAFVTGYSRGKLYRTQIEKTPAGYVARNHLFACLDMLAADCCIAPDGSLVVACHSGGPDWGSGPTGKGKLYKISYTNKDLAQPVFAWPSTPREVRVEFDRPVDPELLHDVLNQIEITAGASVRAGDRFETLWPGYAVVQGQQRAPRRDIRVHSAQLTPDRRTLILATDPLRAAVHYAVTLPGMGRPAHDRRDDKVLPQHPQIDLDFDLSGIHASWSTDGQLIWSGWLPSLDLTLSRKWTNGSAHHDLLWQAMAGQGELTLSTQFDLTDMLRPAVQPGSTLDYELPAEQVFVAYESSAGVAVTAPQADSVEAKSDSHSTSGMIGYTPQRGEFLPLEIQLRKQDDSPEAQFSVSYSTNEDERARPLQLHRTLLPWADADSDPRNVEPTTLPEELEGGSWARGRKVFLTNKPDVQNVIESTTKAGTSDRTCPT